MVTFTSLHGCSGNAAITLRSRLKVKVVKDMLQITGQQPYSQDTPQQQEQNGLPHRHTNCEAGKVTLQLQVRSKLTQHVGVISEPTSCWTDDVDQINLDKSFSLKGIL